jgi:signal transduction histidine kinase
MSSNIKPSVRKKLWLLFTIPAFLVLLQLMFFSYSVNYEDKNFKLQRKAEHLTVVQQFMFDILHNAYTKIPESKFQSMLSAINQAQLILDDHKINFYLSKDPKWSIGNLNSGENTSYQLGPKAWLNYEAKPIFFIYRFAIVLLIINILTVTFIVFYLFSIIRFKMYLKRFRKAADRLGIDINANPIHKVGPSVIKETTEALNKMQNRIKDLIDTRTKMLAAISHDLRTPITRIRLMVGLMGNVEYTDKITRNLDEMSAMITDVLSFARDDAKHESKQKLDLNSLITSIYYEFLDMGYKIHFEPLPIRVAFFGKTLMLKRAITNIINNATRYAENIWLKLEIYEEKILLEITDDGPGMPENELTKVFQPFYRSRNSENKNSTGIGLGLTITQEAIHNHGGIITLTNRKPHGLKVDICFKKESYGKA